MRASPPELPGTCVYDDVCPGDTSEIQHCRYYSSSVLYVTRKGAFDVVFVLRPPFPPRLLALLFCADSIDAWRSEFPKSSRILYNSIVLLRDENPLRLKTLQQGGIFILSAFARGALRQTVVNFSSGEGQKTGSEF